MEKESTVLSNKQLILLTSKIWLCADSLILTIFHSRGTLDRYLQPHDWDPVHNGLVTMKKDL